MRGNVKKFLEKQASAVLSMRQAAKKCIYANILAAVPLVILATAGPVNAANLPVKKAPESSGAPAPHAAGSVAPGEQKLPAPIATMLARGQNVKIVNSFAVPGTTMTGWVMVAGPYKRIYYTPADGSVAVLGLMFDADLNNVTIQHTANAEALVNAVVPFETGASVTKALEAAKKAPASHSEGRGREIYVVYDPACPHCHDLWRETRGSLGRVHITWLPVAKVSSSSAGLAQALLSSQDRAAAMQKAVEKKLDPAQVVAPSTQQILQANAALLDIAGKKNVPMILFVDKGVPTLVLGTPKADVLKRIVGE